MFLFMVFEKFILILLTVGFFTLLERKILSYMQVRKGPNKVSVLGILQPIADAIKLFIKEKNNTKKLNIFLYYLVPTLMMVLTFFSWSAIPLLFSSYHLKYSIMLFIVISSMSVYTVLGVGWFSNSKYSMIGALRSLAQTISYEVVFILLISFMFLLSSNYEISSMVENSLPFYSGLIMAPIMFMWSITVLAETNRAPFDFSEGESELVSGFNVEYGSFEFALLFMSEYCNILILSFFTLILFYTFQMSFVISFTFILFSAIIIVIRGSYPRLRYDSLMNLVWKSYLNISMLLFAFFMCFMFYKNSS